MTRAPRPLGERIIIIYKLVKAALQLTFAVTLLVASRHGLDVRIVALGKHLREHATHPWTSALALALANVTHNVLVLTGIGLIADALVSAFEGWALASGYAWAPWVVAVAGATLIPIEILALVHHVRVGRLLLLIVNVAIVAYLVRRILQRARERESARA